MSELHTATLIADGDLADDVELPARLSGTTGLLKITLAKIKLYLSTALVLVPTGGATGDVLTKVSATDNDVHWAAVAGGGGGGGGGMATLLDTQVAAGASSIVWDNTKITATYKTYLIRYEGVTPSTADVFIVQVSPDNGVTWRTTGYVTQRTIYGLTTSFSNYAQNGTITGFPLVADSNVDAAMPMSGYATFYNLLSASKIDLFQGECMGKMTDGNIYDCKMGGAYNTAAEAHNAIRIVAKGGVATFSGTFKLYGLT